MAMLLQSRWSIGHHVNHDPIDAGAKSAVPRSDELPQQGGLALARRLLQTYATSQPIGHDASSDSQGRPSLPSDNQPDRYPASCEHSCDCGCHGYDDCDCSQNGAPLDKLEERMDQATMHERTETLLTATASYGSNSDQAYARSLQETDGATDASIPEDPQATGGNPEIMQTMQQDEPAADCHFACGCGCHAPAQGCDCLYRTQPLQEPQHPKAMLHDQGPGQYNHPVYPDPAEYHPTVAELEAGAAMLGWKNRPQAQTAPLETRKCERSCECGCDGVHYPGMKAPCECVGETP
ncbi:hypothetical protein WJX84_001832 [Apatococcus fuscideae]|uniref:Uncharacterized protein n=1 Tax=Apatococcus fuscideae TaxID=2026836 RepID=A0AAW1SXI1_9CHLO